MIAIKLAWPWFQLFDFEAKKFISDVLYDVNKFVPLENYIVIRRDMGYATVFNVQNRKNYKLCLENCETMVWLGKDYAAMQVGYKNEHKIINFGTKKIINIMKIANKIIWLGGDIIAVRSDCRKYDGNQYRIINFKNNRPIGNLGNINDAILLNKNKIMIKHTSSDIQLFNLDVCEFGCTWRNVKDMTLVGSNILLTFEGDKGLKFFNVDNNEIFKKELDLKQVLFVASVIRNRNDPKLVDFMRKHLCVWQSITPTQRKLQLKEDKLEHEAFQRAERLVQNRENWGKIAYYFKKFKYCICFSVASTLVWVYLKLGKK